ncbi:MAG TPA: LAGLIDADG family homing endonuclease [Mycobacteriales bacterium]
MAAFDREKALDVALAQIDKQFGKGSVMRLGDENRPPIQVIPTGSIALDVALGVGGLPRGRVVEIYGPESSGKCLTADTWVWTDRGLETIAELFARCGQPVTCTSRVTDIRDLGVRMVNERGELEPVVALTHNNRKPVRRLRLRSGRVLTVTHNHPLRVLNERGYIVWRTAGEIRSGDTVVSALFGAVEAACGDGLSEDEAVFLGYLVAGDARARLHCGREQVAQRYGLDPVTAEDRVVPACVRTAGHKLQRAFLSALFEGDGWIDGSSTVGLGTASEQLAREVQLLLYGLGVPTTVSASWDQTHERDRWTVTVEPASVPRFLTEVGCRSAGQHTQGVESFQWSPRDSRSESLTPAIHTYEEVVAVEDGGSQPTFDVVLADTHSFLANGVISHNTTVALHAVANAQAAGGIAAFIDAEHALDPDYAKVLGVDTDALLVSQPDTGEQALEIADMLIRSGALDVIVIDSVAALVPRAEIEGEMGDSHVGLQARLMSQALRKITGALNNSGTTAIFINQLREKVGVMFGCASYDTRVTLADGSREKIGVIVDRRMPVEVLSYDPHTDRVVPRRVVNWFDNGPAERFLQFTVAGPRGGERFALTSNHLVRTPAGWREAGELVAGDRVMAVDSRRLGDQQWQVILGSLLGGGSLSPDHDGRPGARFGMSATRTGDYLDWKVSLLGDLPRDADAGGAGPVGFAALTELDELCQAVYLGGDHKHIGWEYLKALTPLALAVWYMDGGRLTVDPDGQERVEIPAGSVSTGSCLRLVDFLRDTHGLDVTFDQDVRRVGTLRFTPEASARFLDLVAPCVHPSMGHLLPSRLRGRFAVEPRPVPVEPVLVPARILDVAVRPRHGSMNRYDLQVEGTHNYLADGVMVHNSPETTTGGRALKFYASVRLDVRRIETLKDSGEAVANRTRVKVVKNKVAPPFKQAEFDIVYGQGISREGSLIDVGVEQSIIRKSGAWYTYEGDQLGQGKENVRGFLRDNPDLANEIEKKIKERLGIGSAPVEGSATETAPDTPAAPAAKATRSSRSKSSPAPVDF